MKVLYYYCFEYFSSANKLAFLRFFRPQAKPRSQFR